VHLSLVEQLDRNADGGGEFAHDGLAGYKIVRKVEDRTGCCRDARKLRLRVRRDQRKGNKVNLSVRGSNLPDEQKMRRGNLSFRASFKKSPPRAELRAP